MKDKTTAIILSALLGGLGVDRFYLGYTGMGVLKLLTGGVFGVVWILDIINIASGKLQPADGSGYSTDNFGMNSKPMSWHTQVIKNLLSHPVYIDHMVQGRKKQSFYEGKRQTYVDEANWIIVRNTHEPIIDMETFEKVQQIAKQKKTEYHERLGKFAHLEHTENILQGLVWCPYCQKPLVRYKNVSHGKKLWYTYICPGHADDPARCPFVSIREDELSEVIFTTIQAQIQLAADLEKVVKRLNAQPEFRRQRSDAIAKIEAARRTLKRSQSLYDSLYQNYVEQLMTENEYVTLKARYKAEAEEAERLIAVLEQEQRESKVYTCVTSWRSC